MSVELWDFWEEIGRLLKGVVGYQVHAKKQLFVLLYLKAPVLRSCSLKVAHFSWENSKTLFW